MRKFQVTIRFDMNDEFAALVPPHRTYINRLIEQGIIDHYVVTMETQRVWITFTADNKKDVERYLAKSPLFKYWTCEIDELFIEPRKNLTGRAGVEENFGRLYAITKSNNHVAQSGRSPIAGKKSR